MIKILLMLPAYANNQDVTQTYECIKEAVFPENETIILLYSERDISDIKIPPYTWCFTKNDRSKMFKLLSTSEPGDIIVPLFAGDNFGPNAISEAIQEMHDAEYITICNNKDIKQNLMSSYIYAIRFSALNTTTFYKCFDQSCTCIADSLITHIKKNIKGKTVYVDGAINTLYVDSNFEILQDIDKRNVWAFCAGQYSNDFRGNPKYLFLYLSKYRPDITTYWLCDNESVISQVRHLGMNAYQLSSANAETVINSTGVLVSEQVKAFIPAGLEHAVYLNLWHGVGGVKAVERSLTEGRLAIEIAKKYIKQNEYYRTYEMYLAPSEFIESIACEQLGLQPDQIIHSGYPRNIYQNNCEPVKTFEHNCFKHCSLPDDIRYAAYIPTYRNAQAGDLFASAIPDIEKLIAACEENHICMIFKMHPLLENELSFIQTRETYKDCPWVYFWDNSNDFYEVLGDIDLCIFDYSSMFTDFIAAGCKHYLRYAFDFTADDLEFPLDYDEATLGRKCTSFDQLLDAFSNYRSDDLSDDIERITKIYWEYSTPDSMDKIADAVLAFQPLKQSLPTLYSFDIFDTLISRKVLAPEGIFYKVQELMKKSSISFPSYLIKRYPFIRHNAELNMREYYNRSMVERDDERCEIQFDEIMHRIQILYDLTDEQTALLSQWEIEAELADVIPLDVTINYVKQLLSRGETVILISDMYLPKNVIQQMLVNADPILAELPLFLSSELGYQKSAKSLYMEVYRSFAPDYRFGRWVHHGDNINSDIKNPRTLNIETVTVSRTDFNSYEKALVEELQSYDGYLIAASMARFREKHPTLQEQFTYSFISLLFVPYVYWAMNSCKEHGKENVYLISRDGHQLKKIADVVNEYEQLGLNTKYIYASRRVWRIPSFFDHIDVGFWGQGYGNLAKVNRFNKLLKALDMDEPTFRQMFPELQALNEETEISSSEIVRLAGIFKNSEKYLEYLLKKAEEERYATCEYLKQEMDLDKPFSIIEYWGRGYSQENFTRLWQYVCGRKEPTTFYYSRSTLPSDEDNIRMNFTSHPSSQAFIESIFACINYKTVENYQRIDGKWLPITEQITCDSDLFYCMEQYLPEFAKAYCTLPLTDRDSTGRSLIDFAISWYTEHPEWEGFTGVLAKLIDSVEMYGAKTNFANALTDSSLDEIVNGKTRGQISKNIAISYHCSSTDIQQRFRDMFQIKEGEKLTSGWKISNEAIQKNINARRELMSRQQKQSLLQAIYDTAVQDNVVQQKILLISQGASFDSPEYSSLVSALDKQTSYVVEKLLIKGNSPTPEEFIHKLAKTKIILSFMPLKQLSGIKLRPETHLIILGDTPVQFFYTGLLRKEDLRDVKELSDYNLTNDISGIQIPSTAIAERTKKIYSVGPRTNIMTTGSCITDCYFDTSLRDNLRNRLYTLYPEAEGKKIICYAPLHRYRNAKSKYAHMLDLLQMKKILGNDYFVMLHLMDSAKEMNNVFDIEGFSHNLAKEFTLRNQMIMADVIVADYRDTTFEAPLTGVPTFVTCWDKTSYNNKDSIFCPFDDMMFGVPIRNTDDFIQQLLQLDTYDDSYRQKFIETYLTACDGKSAERLVSSLLNEVEASLVLPDIEYPVYKSDSIVTKVPAVKNVLNLDSISSTLYWMPVPNADYYEVLKSDKSDGHYNTVDYIKSESCAFKIQVSDDSLQAWYKVRAIYNGGALIGKLSKAVKSSKTKQTQYDEDSVKNFSEPKILCIIPSSAGNRLYWNGPNEAAGWRINCQYSNGSSRQVDLLHVNTWEWTDRNGNADKDAAYTITVLYWDSEGMLMEGNSTEFQPTSSICQLKFSVDRILLDKLVLKWKHNPDALLYHLYQKNDVRGIYEHIADINADTVKYSVPVRNNSVTNYILQCETVDGIKINKPIKAYVPKALPKPTGLYVERCEKGNRLLWNTAPNVDSWNIRICTEDDPVGKKIKELPNNQTWWIDTDNVADVSYRIEAVRNIGNSGQFSGYCKAVEVCSE